jgi:hypothetical protein
MGRKSTKGRTRIISVPVLSWQSFGLKEKDRGWERRKMPLQVRKKPGKIEVQRNDERVGKKRVGMIPE